MAKRKTDEMGFWKATGAVFVLGWAFGFSATAGAVALIMFSDAVRAGTKFVAALFA